MAWISEPGKLLREARQRAGLSQRELARRAGTAQSLVARVERGRAAPRTDTLARLLEAAGYDVRLELQPAAVVQTHMLADVARILRLTPEQRLREVANVARFVAEARRE
jgi:transcriptional regulator with XRE-family HTH domain